MNNLRMVIPLYPRLLWRPVHWQPWFSPDMVSEHYDPQEPLCQQGHSQTPESLKQEIRLNKRLHSHTLRYSTLNVMKVKLTTVKLMDKTKRIYFDFKKWL